MEGLGSEVGHSFFTIPKGFDPMAMDVFGAATIAM
jgi:hypothetical protein